MLVERNKWVSSSGAGIVERGRGVTTAVSSIHRVSEKAHSRKPALIHPHTYKAPGRRQAGLFSELPRRVLLGNPYSSTRIAIRDRGRVWAYRDLLRVGDYTPCNADG